MTRATQPIMQAYQATSDKAKANPVMTALLVSVLAGGGANYGLESISGHPAQITKLETRVVELEKYVDTQKRADEIADAVREQLREQRRAAWRDSIRTR